MCAPTKTASQESLEFERAVKIQTCLAGDLYTIASDCALHVSTAGTELLRTQRVLTQPVRPIWSQCAVYGAGCGVLIDADQRCKQAAYVIHVTLAPSGDTCSPDPAAHFANTPKICPHHR